MARLCLDISRSQCRNWLRPLPHLWDSVGVFAEHRLILITKIDNRPTRYSCGIGFAKIPGAVATIPGRLRRRHTVGADGFLVGEHATGWPTDRCASGGFAGHRVPGGVQPGLPRIMDRFDPKYHAGRLGAGVRLSVDRSRLLLGRDRTESRHRVGAWAGQGGEVGE